MTIGQGDLFSSDDEGELYKREPNAPLHYDEECPTYQSVNGVASVAPIVITPDEVTLLVRLDPQTGALLGTPKGIPVNRREWTQLAPGVEVKLVRVTGSVYCELEVSIVKGD